MDLNGTTFSSVKFDDLSKARGGIFNRRRWINKFDYSLICACDKPVNSYSPLFVENFFLKIIRRIYPLTQVAASVI